MRIFQIKVSPSLFSYASLLLGSLWSIAAGIFMARHGSTLGNSFSKPWETIFLICGPFASFCAWMAFDIRRGERSALHKLDLVAIVLACIIAICYAGFVLYFYLETQGLRSGAA
jgi:hypothetical protein